MAFDTAAGATLAISATLPATFDATGYAALSMVDVGEVTNIGEFGKEFALVTHNPLSSRGTKKGKGSFNNGAVTPTLALDNDDAGQEDMRDALESDDAVAFKLTLDNGDAYYFAALVMSFKPSVGGVDDVITATTNLEIDHNPIVLVAA